MTDFFKNNPTALRHCIRFEVLQGNSIEQAYSNICSVIGNELIDHKNFKLSFNQFSTGKSNNKEKEKPIAEILRNDKNALRVCILYESLKYQSVNLNGPIFKTFVNFCKVIGVEDVLKFPEFEFWFYRFLNGDHDLNYERDKDKKIYELMDMPIHVMENIAEYLDIFDRANLVQTSHSLQTFVKDQKLFHDTLRLFISSDTAIVSLGKSVNIQYIKNYAACKKIFKNCERLVRGVAYWRQALLDSKEILKNPKLHLDYLVIRLHIIKGNVFNGVEDALKFTHHLNVKSLILEECSTNLLARILPLFKPGYLKTICVFSRSPRLDSMETVFQMEQWKQSECYKMNGFFLWPLHHLSHFKKFHVGLKDLSVEYIREMKESLFKSQNFEKGSIWVFGDTGAKAIEEEFGDYVQEDPFIYHYPIPNSADYFEIKVEVLHFEHRIEVTRKKK